MSDETSTVETSREGRTAADLPEQAAPAVDLANLEDVEEAMRDVVDPELGINVVDLGLVYEIKIGDDSNVKITMTLTAPACPVAGDIVRDVQEKVEALPDVMDCHVNLTFDPPWTKDRMSEAAKLALGLEDIIPIARIRR